MLNNLKYIKLFSPGFLLGIKPVFYIIFYIVFVFSTRAQQNLVPNGSFEEYWECPTANNLNDGQFERCKYWWNPTMGSSDYFNRCNNGVVNVPNNFWGHQEAYHGDGYVGFVPISIDSIGNIDSYEYIQTQLTSPLKPCYQYYFSMYACMANYSTHSIGRLGAVFSSDTIFNNYNNWGIINFNPQVVNILGPIKDSVNWVKIDGYFNASGFEKFLTIGYFYNEVTNDTTFFNYLPSSPGYFSPYYYIDSVSLYEIEKISTDLCDYQIDFPNVFTPNKDGINDVISMEQYEFLIEDIIILNRWGNIVTTLNKDEPLWNGENCPEGIYYYIIRLKDYKKQQTGFIHLVR